MAADKQLIGPSSIYSVLPLPPRVATTTWLQRYNSRDYFGFLQGGSTIFSLKIRFLAIGSLRLGVRSSASIGATVGSCTYSGESAFTAGAAISGKHPYLR